MCMFEETSINAKVIVSASHMTLVSEWFDTHTASLCNLATASQTGGSRFLIYG